MCRLLRTRYTCAHLSPLHPLGYQRPPPETDKTQSDRATERPTHPDTSIESCEDATRQGHRCEGPLGKLEVTEKAIDLACLWCVHGHADVGEMVSALKEWTRVGGWSDGSGGQDGVEGET
jgi:hypothetical protein